MPAPYDDARATMLQEHLIKRGIHDARVLAVMANIPRHLFVPEEYRAQAYADKALKIGQAQTISQPYMVALMTQLLDLQPDDTVLEIGTGSGYQTAILAALCRRVISLERHRSLSESAHAKLKALGIHNVQLHVGDGTLGLEADAPFSAIMVTAGGPQISETLQQQLKEGGRMVCPVGDRRGQRLMCVTRQDDTFKVEAHSRCTFVPLIGEEGWEA